MLIFQIIHILSGFLVSDLTDLSNQNIPFNVLNPELKIELSKELKEISGLTWYNKNQLGVVQDEAGIFYILNTGTGKIEERIKFAFPGDFEGVEVVGTCVYALTSSGKIFYFDIQNNKNAADINTPLSWKNDAEGLAYDSRNKELLIVCKESGSVSTKKNKGKSIFSLRIEDHYFNKTPLAVIKKSDIQKHIDIEKFKPSGIAVDPITNDIYIIASVGKLLVVLDKNYKIKASIKLPPTIYAQPEGICFSPLGDLFISNEGKHDSSNFYHFKRK